MSPRQKEYIVVIPDFPNADRSPYREEHLSGFPPLVDKGVYSLVGPTISDDKPGPTGSLFSVIADSSEEALEIVKKDTFARNGVWDISKAQIFPYIPFARSK